MSLSSKVVVRYQVPGFHRWNGAPTARAYLAQHHRHLFHVEVCVEVFEDDREIEFHDLLDFCKVHFPGGELGGQSCEMMARGLVQKITHQFGLKRRVSVGVFEDGEVGGVVTFTPPSLGEDPPM